ncbi:FecR family protein [Pseudopedobacter beijingensis]|uniref:FecR family protein n=1 Tax=Pseudopedobacter beijingensis TaxID=1207056 RepID=A0ABW4IIJ3_9SPHI
MHNVRTEISVLIFRKLQGTITSEELSVLEEWTNVAPENRTLLDELSNEELLVADLKLFDELWKNRDGAKKSKKMEQVVLSRISVPVKSIWKKWLPYAAILVGITVCVGLWMLNHYHLTREKQPISINLKKIPSIDNGAVLTLADGQKISLNTEQEGIIISDNILYQDSSMVLDNDVYSINRKRDLKNNSKKEYLTLTTPKGVSYKVILSDGTQVWLNAGTTLSLPAKFEDEERIVELQGEAYFDVASKINKVTKSKVPFIVKTNGQSLRVIGTQFNVSAYEGDTDITTTLVEGIVAIRPVTTKESGEIDKQEIILKPNQQSKKGLNGAIQVKEVDVTSFIAWKENLFHFKNTPLDEMMKQIARWYDLKVVYTKGIPEETFTGKMSKNLPIQSIVELLNASNISVRLEGKKLIVN